MEIKLWYNRFGEELNMGDMTSTVDIDTKPAVQSMERLETATADAERATESFTSSIADLENSLANSDAEAEAFTVIYDKYNKILKASVSNFDTLRDKIKSTANETSAFQAILDKIQLRDMLHDDSSTTMSEVVAVMGDANRVENMLIAGRQRYNDELKKSEELAEREARELQNMQVEEIEESFRNVSKHFDNIVNQSSRLNSNVDKIVDKFDNSSFAGAMSRATAGDYRVSRYERGSKSKGVKKGDIKSIDLLATRESKFANVQAGIDKSNSKMFGLGELKNLLAGYKKSTEEASEANDDFAKSSDKAKSSVSEFFGTLTGKLVKLRILTGAIRGVVQFLGQLYDKAAEYQESLNLYTLALGEYGEQGKQWANKISKELYLDPTNILQYTGAMYNLTKGLGVAANDAYVMATNLTQLAYDMSSYLNIGVDAAMTKIQSAIVGQSRAVQTAGVAMQMASLQQLAYEMGIKTTVNEMTQAEKTYLRYIQIMRSTTKMQGDLGRTIISPANAVRTLKTQFELLARSLGSVLIPIVLKVLPYIMALTKQLENLAKQLAKTLGYKLLDWETDTSSASFFENYINGLEDVDKASAKTKNSLSRTLAAFDDLNVVESEGSGSGSGAGGLSDDDMDKLKKAIEGYDMLKDKTDQWDESIEAATKNLETIEKIVGSVIAVLALFKIGKGVTSFLAWLGGFKASTGLSGWLTAVGAGFSKIAPILGPVAIAIGAIVGVLTSGITIGNTWAKLLNDSTAELTGFEKAMGVVAAVITATNPALGVLIGTVALFTAGIKKSVREIDMFAGVSEKTKEALEPLVNKWKDTSELINQLDFKPRLLTDEDVERFNTNFSVMVEGVKTGLQENKTIVDTFFSGLSEDTANSLGDLKLKFDEYYTEKNTSVEDYEKRANEIVATARKENRELTETELKELQVLNTKILEEGARAYSETEEEFKKLSIRIGEEANVIQVEQASKYLKTALDTKNKAIETAKQEYEGIVLEAGKLRDAGKITDDEYNKMVEAARTKRDDDIKAAEEEYDKIYNTIKLKLGDSAKYIDKETGNIKSNWQIWCDDIGWFASQTWENIKENFRKAIDWIKEKWENLKDWFKNFSFPKLKVEWSTDGAKEAGGWVKDALKALNLPTKLPKLNIKWFEEGGYPDSGDLFFANENGRAEYITSVGNKTAVANQDQMTTALADTITRAIGSLNTGGSNGDIVVYIGNDKVYQGQGEYQSRQTDRYGTTYVRI